MNVKNKSARILCALLSAVLLVCGLPSCASTSEVPEGYQYATCGGEYFRLFVPTQWTVNTESGISSAFTSDADVMVSMTEVNFTPAEDSEASPLAQFVDSHVAELPGLMKDYKQEKSFDSTLAGYRAKDITYVGTVDGTTLRFRQVLTRVVYRSEEAEARFFVFTYSAPTADFDARLDAVDEILENVTFESFPFEGEDDRKIPDNVEAPEGMKLVSDNEVAYRFYAPESWIRDVNNGQNFVYVSETDRSNVSMMAYNPVDYTVYTVEQYWAECKAVYEVSFENFTLVSESDTTLDGGTRAAKVYEYTYTLGGVTYRTRQTICMVSMVYAMTYTATAELYDAHLEDVLKMEQAIHFRGLME